MTRYSLRSTVAIGCLLVPLWAALCAPALAQKEASEDRATSFEAVEGAPKEDVPGGPLLIGAYAFVLVLLIGYSARIGALQARTGRELERLTRALESRGKGE